MKLPTFKDLNYNIKGILWSEQPKTFQEFKAAHSAAFCRQLGGYLTRHKANTTENFQSIYQVIFVYGFFNYLKEAQLKSLLESKGYKVKISDMVADAILGVDLIALKNNNVFYFQVKPLNQIDKFNKKKLQSLTKYTKNIFVAWLSKDKWTFKNILNNQVFGLDLL